MTTCSFSPLLARIHSMSSLIKYGTGQGDGEYIFVYPDGTEGYLRAHPAGSMNRPEKLAPELETTEESLRLETEFQGGSIIFEHSTTRRLQRSRPLQDTTAGFRTSV